MKDGMVKVAGSALIWKSVQHAGVKSIFLIRLLILARLLSPDDFGLLAIAVTAIGFLLSVTDFGMVPALVQRSEIDDRHYNAGWTVGVVRAIVISAVVFLGAPFIADIFAEPRAINILRVLAIRPLLDASASIRLAELIKDLKFRSLAFVKLSEALINTIVAISLARTFGVWALVAGALFGSLAYLVMSYLMAPHRPRLSFDTSAARPLIRFGRWIFMSGLIAVSGGAVLRIVISRQLGAIELGIYYLAASLAFMPADLASKVAAEVAFPLYSRLQSDIRQATQAFQGMFTGIVILLVPACALLIALAPSLVQDILGPRWAGTIPLIRIIATVSFIGLFGEAIVPILKGLGQPYKVTVIEAVQSVLIIVFVWGLTENYGLIGAALAWLPAIAVSQGVCSVFAKQVLYRPFDGLKAPVIAVISSSVVGAIVAFGIDSNLPGVIGFVIASLSALVVFAILLWKSDRWLELGLAHGIALIFPQIAAFVGYSPAES
jgi:O-antigen/teichoic acid export membrane protein